MAGIYVAKPADAVALVLPPGWNIGEQAWPWPGPWPPGYTPDLSLTLAGAVTYAPGAEHENTAVLYDRTTYKTGQPNNERIVNYTATTNGAATQLKISGEAEWLDTVEVDYAEDGSNFWGSVPTLVFNVSTDQEDEVITLFAFSEPFTGHTVQQTHDITIVVVRHATVECLMTSTPQPMSDPGDVLLVRSWGHRMEVEDTSTGALGAATVNCQAWQFASRKYNESVLESHATNVFPYNHPSAATFNTSASLEDRDGVDELYYLNSGTYPWFIEDFGRIPRRTFVKIMDLTDADEWRVVYRFLDHSNLDNSVVYDFTFKLYENGVLTETKTSQVTVASGYSSSTYFEWLRVTDVGVITIITP